ncbi:purine and uridine phosphorylase [Colletotrichum eremochloae]|nr:purine and uridine phosphorylase [Colletotrichum eremochloae]
MSDPQNYTVGWICAIPAEFAAARAFLDEQHPDPEAMAQNDSNTYALGTMGKHNVVIAVMPKNEYGTAAAATVARDMVHSFPNVRIGLMVGVGGGAPSQQHDIRLGDVVVSSREAGNGGVIQYDYGKAMQNQAFVETGVLNQPPPLLLTAVAKLEGDYTMKGSELNAKVERALSQWKRLRKTHSRPSSSTDQLYRSDFVHPSGSSAACSQECSANISNVVSRDERGEDEDNPAIHYGLIASANQVMKNAETRDKLSRERGVLCFEMEAAGLMNHFPCLVVRGICDYSDSHKNKEWQGYAAMAAAASHIQKIRQWLSPPDTSANYNLARERRHEGTGLWFLDSTAFREWVHGTRKHLWLHGMPGSGKTVLITTVLDHLAQRDDLDTLDFFFDFSDTSKQKPEDMCRSLAFQLYTKRIESRKELDSLLASHGDGQIQPTAQALSQCFQKMMQTEGRLCIVLDALDECIKKPDLLRWIQSVISSSNLSHVQLIATGRPEKEFMRHFRSWIGESCLHLDVESTNTDIQSYINSRLTISQEFSKWASTPGILQQIQKEVGGKAQGMFRWAACQLDSLEKCLDLEELEAAMEALPSDLNATYARILQNIPQKRRKKTVRLLQFLVYSKQPLTLQECVDVIAVRVDGAQSFNPRDRLPEPTDILRFCPSLIVLMKTPGTARGGGLLQLAHFTVKEYLLHGVEGFRGTEPSISITETCLFYLASVEETLSIVEGTLLSKVTRLFPLATYAARIWEDHARVAEKSSDTAAAILSFLQSEKRVQIWRWLCHSDCNFFSPILASSGFYYACRIGLAATARIPLSDRPNVNATGFLDCFSPCGHAVSIASFGDHREIVQSLLDSRARANTNRPWTDPALQDASYWGHREIVQLLLNAGADVNAKGRYSSTALDAASRGGHRDIVQLLLDAGADINALNAIRNDHPEIVQLLLNAGANVDAIHSDGSTALQYASLIVDIQKYRSCCSKLEDKRAFRQTVHI